MKTISQTLLIALICTQLHGASQPSTLNNSANQIQIVTLHRDVDVDKVINEFGLKPRHRYHHAIHGFAAAMDTATAARLKADARIRTIEPDGRVVLCSQTPSTGIIRMGLTNFPEAHINGQDHRINVDVAVLDTGIQLDHPDLNVVQGVDLTGSGLNGNDWDGHGTHVAGIIGALDNNIGVVGVAPGVNLWSVQVVGPNDDYGNWSDVIAGCDYIATNVQIAVVNCSLASDGSPTPYDAIHQAVTNLVNLGIVFVAAAGNSTADIATGGSWGDPRNIVPAAFAEVMAVTAMDPINNYIATFCNYSNWPHDPSFVNSPGAAIDLTEPGVNILSTYTNSGYATLEGTSMACGFASGLVALYIAANGRATNAQGVYAIRQALIDSGQPQTNWGVPYTYDPDGNLEPLGIPSESWIPLPNITSATMMAQGFQLSFATVPGYTYIVQAMNSLNSSCQWTNLTSTNGSGSLTTVTVTDPTPATTRYYQLARQPAP
jgi:subtilisin